MEEAPAATTTTTAPKPPADDSSTQSESKSGGGGFVSGLLPKSRPAVSWVWNTHATGWWQLLAAEPIVPFSIGVIVSIYLLISGLISGEDKSYPISVMWIIFGSYIIISTATGGYRGETVMDEEKE